MLCSCPCASAVCQLELACLSLAATCRGPAHCGCRIWPAAAAGCSGCWRGPARPLHQTAASVRCNPSSPTTRHTQQSQSNHTAGGQETGAGGCRADGRRGADQFLDSLLRGLVAVHEECGGRNETDSEADCEWRNQASGGHGWRVEDESRAEMQPVYSPHDGCAVETPATSADAPTPASLRW